jgi:hypothetical protein
VDRPVMMTIRVPSGAPSLDEVKQRYGLESGEIDESFGVVEIDPETHSYTILVEASAASKVQPGGDWEAEGPFSNPTIEPMWPPK